MTILEWYYTVDFWNLVNNNDQCIYCESVFVHCLEWLCLFEISFLKIFYVFPPFPELLYFIIVILFFPGWFLLSMSFEKTFAFTFEMTDIRPRSHAPICNCIQYTRETKQNTLKVSLMLKTLILRNVEIRQPHFFFCIYWTF